MTRRTLRDTKLGKSLCSFVCPIFKRGLKDYQDSKFPTDDTTIQIPHCVIFFITSIDRDLEQFVSEI